MAQRSDDTRPDDAVARGLAGEPRVEITRDGDLVEPESRGGLTIRRATASGGLSDLPRTAVDQTTQELLDDLRSER